MYITDSIKNINDSISNLFGGSVFKERYCDLISKEQIKDPDKTAEEIKSKIIGKLAALED